MARISKEERLRQEGMAQAYRIAQTRGIDGLKKEIEIRKLTGIFRKQRSTRESDV